MYNSNDNYAMAIMVLGVGLGIAACMTAAALWVYVWPVLKAWLHAATA